MNSYMLFINNYLKSKKHINFEMFNILIYKIIKSKHFRQIVFNDICYISFCKNPLKIPKN